MSAITRPIVRYHGGKWKLAPWIVSQFPAHRVYVEPFGGGGSVLLRKPRSYAEVYNDLDGEIVNLFRVARDRGHELKAKLELTPFSRTDFEESYEPSEDAVEQARRTVTRAFMGFGSNAHNKATGFRSNSNRSGTTPAHDWRNYPNAFEAIIERLRGVVIENRRALDVIEAHDSPEALFYVDPPYVLGTRGKGTDYRYEMTDEEHKDLLCSLGRVQGAVVISGYPHDLYETWCHNGWQRLEYTGAHADGARDRTEVLWMRNIKSDLFTK